jgi:regulator of sigma E protease
MLSLFVFLLVLGILILVHEFGHFIAAKRVGVIVEIFSLGFGPKLISRKKGQTEYSLAAIPFGGYVKMAGDNLEEYKGTPGEYLSKKPGQRAQIIFCGPLLNYVLGFLCFWAIFFAGYPTLTNKVGGLLDGFGAQEAGIQAGDRIISVQDKSVTSWEQLQIAIQESKGAASVKVGLLRGSEKLVKDVSLKEKQVNDVFGKKQSVGLLGITPSEETIIVRHGLGESLFLGARKTWDLTMVTYKAFGMLITGRLSMRESVTGPLGIFYVTHQATSLGVIPVVHLIAVLSVSLAIFNLLPLPVLDGGHILFLLIEKIRGKGLSLKTESIITRVGLTLILTLAVVVTYNDILKFGGKIAKWFVK